MPGRAAPSHTICLPHAPTVAQGDPSCADPNGKHSEPPVVGVHPVPVGQSVVVLHDLLQTRENGPLATTHSPDWQSKPLPHGHPTARPPGFTQNENGLPRSHLKPAAQLLSSTQRALHRPPPVMLGAQIIVLHSGGARHGWPGSLLSPRRQSPMPPVSMAPTCRHCPKSPQNPVHPTVQNASWLDARQKSWL